LYIYSKVLSNSIVQIMRFMKLAVNDNLEIVFITRKIVEIKCF